MLNDNFAQSYSARFWSIYIFGKNEVNQNLLDISSILFFNFTVTKPAFTSKPAEKLFYLPEQINGRKENSNLLFSFQSENYHRMEYFS